MNQRLHLYVEHARGNTWISITYGVIFIIYNEPGGTPLYRLCVRVHFIIYNEPWGHTLIQSPKQPTPTYTKHTETVHWLPIACEIAVGSLWNGSVCFLQGCVGCLGDCCRQPVECIGMLFIWVCRLLWVVASSACIRCTFSLVVSSLLLHILYQVMYLYTDYIRDSIHYI